MHIGEPVEPMQADLLLVISLYWLVIHFEGAAYCHVVEEASYKGAAFTDCSNTASFPAMFGFGTSLSDTGNGILSSPILFPAKSLPYGSTFFGRPNGRFCDGRIMIDFVAEAIGMPFLNPYFNKTAKGTDFSKGVNYAVAGATVQKTGKLLLQGDVAVLTTYSMDVQLQWHLYIKQAAQQTTSSPPSIPDVVLPDSGSFSEALYFIEFGGNDYGSVFLSRSVLSIQRNKPINNTYTLQHFIPVVIDKMVGAIELLYANEARNFLVLNLFPEGCAPLYLRYIVGSKDTLGCLEAFNEVDVAHNRRLLSALQRLTLKYPDIHLMYADVAKAYTDVLQRPSSYGFKDTQLACCGAGPQSPFQFSVFKLCGPRSYECDEPSTYVVWDGIHNTDSMNNILISSLTSGENLVCLRPK